MFAFFPVSLLCTCNISFSYYNNQSIPEELYENNTFGFRVLTSGECPNLTIMNNGTKYENRTAFNEVGNYTITSNSVVKNITILPIDDKKMNVTHITFHMATFSVIQSLQQLINISKSENNTDNIMVYYNRPSTLDREAVIRNLNTTNVFPYAKVNEMKKTIWELYKNYAYIFIHFYCEDIRAHYIPLFFINQGIPADRYKIILNCDGSNEYTNFYKINNEDKWKQYNETFIEKLALANVGTLKDPRDTEYSEQMFFYATLPNVMIVPHSMEYLQSNISIVNETISSMNKQVLDPIRDLQKMPEEQQEMYFNMTGVNKEYWKKEYFPKKPMMIIGTRAQDYGSYFSSLEEFRIYLVSLMTFYSNNYSVCFKPHPVSVITKEFRKMMNESNIHIIETQIPGEAIMAALGEVKVGGYFSTIFFSGTPDFIFAENSSGVYEFYRPTLEKLNCKFVATSRSLRQQFGDEFVDGKKDNEESSSVSSSSEGEFSSSNENNSENNSDNNEEESKNNGEANQSSGSTGTSTKVAVAAVVPIVVLGAVCVFLVILLIRKPKNEKIDQEP